ncbi:DNA ligase D [Hydrocarboniphaga sp.]|uniref:DNA ligase D n=1 Tax=Hydrocarboniphaga sp. TaxID=2033016 RepID=UPI003D13A069
MATKARSTAKKQTSARADPLQHYNTKRRFDVTSEPAGKHKRGKAGFAYVIQQHDATRMHFDFRLELDGVLLSWAVPKGPSLSVQEKRLAVQTEDHPLDYRDFEGHIPEGEYGGGPVIVWDRGTWTPEDDPRRGMEKGHLTFALHGEKLQGRFQLVRLKGRGKELDRGPKSIWLLMKRSDEFVREGAAAEPTQKLTRSVISGKTVKQIGQRKDAAKPPHADTAATRAHAAKNKASKLSAVLTPPSRPSPASGGRSKASSLPCSRARVTVGAKKLAELLENLSPQLAQLTETVPEAGDYRYEVKFDGYRLLAGVADGAAQLRSRNNINWTDTFPDIKAAVAALAAKQAVIDGELCYLKPDGRSDFQLLQNTLGMRGGKGRMPQQPIEHRNLVFYVFDLLFENGEDLRPLPLSQRKQRLAALMKRNRSPVLRYSEDLDGEARTILAQACKLGLEGIIGKKADAPYREGRSRDWIKLKCNQRQEFVIVGYSESDARAGFRSLLLGLRDNGELRFAGRVGTGFNDQSIADLSKRLKKLVIEKSALAKPPKERGLIWVKPELVCEVSYTEMTRDGSLRHPSFEGLRLDKPAKDVVRETPEKPPKKAAVKAAKKVVKASTTKSGSDDTVAGVRISHPERIMDEDSGLTKLQLAQYHQLIADSMMIEAANRPLAVVRCPQGDVHECFFQKNLTPGIGPHVKSLKHAGLPGLLVTEPRGIIELVQFNAMELHGWGSKMPRPEQPDWLIFDLDPDTSLKFSDVVNAALELREILKSAGLPTFVKTTGGKGLHVVVPLIPSAEWDEVKEFCKQVAQTLAQMQPERYVANMAKAKRGGKIFIDYLRNGRGATAVLPYSPRARPGAPVALPIEWSQLKAGLDPREFRVDNAAQWLRKRRDPWKALRESAVTLPKLVSMPARRRGI